MASHESTYRPGSNIAKWMDARLPAAAHDARAVRGFPDAAQHQLSMDHGRPAQLLPGRADRHRHRAGHALRAERRRCVQQRRAHPPRRELRLADPQHSRRRRILLLPGGLHPHRARPLLRLLQGAARGAVDPGRRHLPADDGHGIHGLLAALGPDELLGGDRDHQPVLLDRRGHSRPRHPHRAVAVGRLFGIGDDAQPLLCPALSAALRDRRRGRACTSGRCTWWARTTPRGSTSSSPPTRCRWRPTRS